MTFRAQCERTKAASDNSPQTASSNWNISNWPVEKSPCGEGRHSDRDGALAVNGFLPAVKRLIRNAAPVIRSERMRD